MQVRTKQDFFWLLPILYFINKVTRVLDVDKIIHELAAARRKSVFQPTQIYLNPSLSSDIIRRFATQLKMIHMRAIFDKQLADSHD